MTGESWLSRWLPTLVIVAVFVALDAVLVVLYAVVILIGVAAAR